jgi:hypothetical protein
MLSRATYGKRQTASMLGCKGGIVWPSVSLYLSGLPPAWPLALLLLYAFCTASPSPLRALDCVFWMCARSRKKDDEVDATSDQDTTSNTRLRPVHAQADKRKTAAMAAAITVTPRMNDSESRAELCPWLGVVAVALVVPGASLVAPLAFEDESMWRTLELAPVAVAPRPIVELAAAIDPEPEAAEVELAHTLSKAFAQTCTNSTWALLTSKATVRTVARVSR